MPPRTHSKAIAVYNGLKNKQAQTAKKRQKGSPHVDGDGYLICCEAVSAFIENKSGSREAITPTRHSPFDGLENTRAIGAFDFILYSPDFHTVCVPATWTSCPRQPKANTETHR